MHDSCFYELIYILDLQPIKCIRHIAHREIYEHDDNFQMKYHIAKSYLKINQSRNVGDISVSVNLMHLSSSYSIVRNVQINIKRIYLYYKADIHESFYGIKGQIDKIPISTHI